MAGYLNDAPSVSTILGVNTAVNFAAGVSGSVGKAGVLLAQGRMRLVENKRMLGQLRQLERRTTPGGRDRVNHPPGGRDDVSNAAMGALLLASRKSAAP